MPNPERIIRLKTVLHRTGLSRSTLARSPTGHFPGRCLSASTVPGGMNRLSIAGLPIRQATAPMTAKERRHEGGSTRSEEHTSELQSLMRISYAVFCLKKTTKDQTHKG